TESFANIFAEARKYRLNLALAHQYIAQLNEKVKDSIFGNIGTLVSFRLGPEDAEFLEKYFAPEFVKEDLINLPNYNFYIKLMIDGVLSKSFSAMNIPPSSLPQKSYIQEIIEYSRNQYSAPRQEVERNIAHWELLDFSPSRGTKSRDEKFGTKEGWEATCSQCGKRIIVPFKPDPSRPVYCEDCFREIKRAQNRNPESESIKPSKSKVQPNQGEIKNIIKNIFHQDN
ncbi:MAG: CxxC-x17-CxxC domain-containing protein, partial [Candidatus Paceibacterota bacterium]